MSTKNIFIIVGLVAIGVLVWTFSVRNNNFPSVENRPPINIEETPSGTVATTTGGNMLYRNEKLGVQFTFPSNWHLGTNTIGNVSGHGYMQLFNYNENQAVGKSIFPEGYNKIEAVVGERSFFSEEPSSDYPEQSRNTEEVVIAKQKATKVDITLMGGQKIRTYNVPLPNPVGDYILKINIYGDPDNFYVLDQLVNSIEWLE